EAGRNPGERHLGRRGLSGRRPADRGCARSARGGECDRRRNRFRRALIARRTALSFPASHPGETPMAKGYVISRVDITDPEAYARYSPAATTAIAAHGGKTLARGGRHEALEGRARARNVILEFDSYEAARAYFYSAEYQAARALREGAAEIEMVLVEGV